GPVPEYCESVSHEVVRLPGVMDAVHGWVLSATLRPSDVGGSTDCMVSVAGDTLIFVGVEGAFTNDTVSCVCSVLPNSSFSEMNTVLVAGGVMPLPHKGPCSDPYAARRVVPKMLCIRSLMSMLPATRPVT